MPTFNTPDPITVDVKLVGGRVRIIASDRQDSVVRVEPDLPSATSGRVRVNLTGSTLKIRSAQSGGIVDKRGAVEVTVEVPSRSSLVARTANAEIRARGVLGTCRLHGTAGLVELDRTTGPVHAHVADGTLRIGHAGGDVDVRSGRSAVHIDEVRGDVTVRAATGPVVIGTAGGDLTVATAGGDVAVERAAANVTFRTAWGNLRVGEVAGGRVDVATGTGNIEIGIRAGLAAWVDASSKSGEVRSLLPARGGPPSTEHKAEVRARTQHGDILIRSAVDPAAPSGSAEPDGPTTPRGGGEPAASAGPVVAGRAVKTL
ncbi:DUF4097 domain-containing protein [Frankia sp. AiPs1]|uniref:DUF4097 family beta strand repeat-containing protein n=1 Tax=Frankia sp. AiPa1 TaxID=573492 RepID=UPI00202B8C1F|nr:DUF4097 family beta strand repeat-containing protein [Frankia sp. AiPa1]MCL9757930.1 DUF4097 domain-containing protein [Frankia sp. AiPa1]